MSLTVVNATATLNRRWGECAALADVQDALYRSGVILGITPATMGTVVNADLTSITAAQYPQMMDVAEERGLTTILANLDQVNLTAIGVKTDPEKLRLKYAELLRIKRQFIKDAYGIGMLPLAIGTVDFNFQSEFDPTTDSPEYF